MLTFVIVIVQDKNSTFCFPQCVSCQYSCIFYEVQKLSDFAKQHCIFQFSHRSLVLSSHFKLAWILNKIVYSYIKYTDNLNVDYSERLEKVVLSGSVFNNR